MIAHSSFLTEGIRDHADVVFPAEVYPEKQGTIVHPDGRLQRLRPAIARPAEVDAEWHVLSELALRLGLDLDVLGAAMASRQLFERVPFYGGLTLEEIGGRGVRWQEREAAAAFPAEDPAGETAGETGSLAELAAQVLADGTDGASAAVGYRSLWDAPEVRFSPAFDFLSAEREPA